MTAEYTAPEPLRGYIEGYYGRLLDWPQRERIVRQLHLLGMAHYLYAPKEDPCHRFAWRTPYDTDWRDAFSAFCGSASMQGVQIIAGIAPGIDFDFAHLPGGDDYAILCRQCREFVDDGAAAVALMLDDIDADFDRRQGRFAREGQAHAALANALADDIATPVMLVPRAYAGEIADTAPDYWPDLATGLDVQIPVFWCGEHIVSRQPDNASLLERAPAFPNPVIIWDNLYANDYCPRKLYVGPFVGRAPDSSLMLNPTGMVETDRLLLDLMADMPPAGQDDSRWSPVLRRHGVPEAFDTLAGHFRHPPFFDEQRPHPVDGVSLPLLDSTRLDALDTCLWQWKGALAMEWYPYLMGLKQDALLARGELPAARVWKTQSIPLAQTLTSVIGGYRPEA